MREERKEKEPDGGFRKEACRLGKRRTQERDGSEKCGMALKLQVLRSYERGAPQSRSQACLAPA